MILSLPKFITTGEMTLRRVRISDRSLLSKNMTEDDTDKSSSDGRPGCTPWIFYLRLRRTFFTAYCIEYEREVIGFIGLYNLVPAESAEISLALFEPSLRRKGHGTRAVQMLFQSTVVRALANTIIAKVRKDNISARSFWAKLGFQEVGIEEDVMVMIRKNFRAPIVL